MFNKQKCISRTYISVIIYNNMIMILIIIMLNNKMLTCTACANESLRE